MIYAQSIHESSETVLKSISNDPRKKKIYNFLNNELLGIMKRYDFDYSYDNWFDDIFLKKMIQILNDEGFMNERYDKKKIRTCVESLLESYNFVVDDYKPSSVWFSYNSTVVSLTDILSLLLK